jgi:hypothetical protein
VRRAGAFLFAVAFAAAIAAAALAAQSPRQLRAAIFTAARAKHSVHYVALTVAAFRTRIIGDASGDRGTQSITVAQGPNVGHLTVRVVAHTAYLRGDTFTLHAYLGFTTSQATTYHGQWISIPSTHPTYSTIADSVTFRSFLSDLYPKGTGLVGVSGTLDGDKVIGVRVARLRGGLHVVSTLYARAHGTLLPFKEREFAPGHGYTSASNISRWNEPVHVRAPAHAVPIATVLSG